MTTPTPARPAPALNPKNHGIYNTGSAALWKLADVFIERGMSVKPLAASRENFDIAHEIQRAAEIVQAHERPAWDVDAAIDRLIAGWMAAAQAIDVTAELAAVEVE